MSITNEDAQECLESLKKGSKSFYAASRLLPRRLRQPTAAVYAFCRATDDFVDLNGGGEKRLEGLLSRLERVYEQRGLEDPVDRAFSWVVHEFGIPKGVPEALFEGYRWDLSNRRYSSLAEVRQYSTRVAATVGVMMTLLMERRDWATLARACDLGVAMQLTNIARDVGEDARAGRVYLPTEWFPELGLTVEAWLEDVGFLPEIGTMVERLLAEADRLYLQAEAGIPKLPADCRAAIWAARFIYADIGRVIHKRGMDSVSGRAYTTKSRKLRLFLRAFRARRFNKKVDVKGLRAPPLGEVEFLLDLAGEKVLEGDQTERELS